MLGHDAQQLAARMAKVIHGGVASEVPPADSPVSPSDSSSSSSGSGSSNGTQNPSNNASRPQPTRPLMPYHAPNAKMQQEAMMVEPSASSVLAQRHTRGTPSLEVASVPTGARAHSGASVASGGAHFSDPERRATRFPQHLIPSDFTHVQLIFRSKNTLLFKARRRVAQRSSATASGSSAPVSSTASSLHPQLALVRGVSSLPILDPLGDLHSLTTSSNDASSPHASERPAASGLPHGEERQCNEGKRYEMVVLKMPNLFSINKEATGGAQTNTQLAGADDEPDVAGGTRAGDLTQLGGVDSSLKAAAAQAPAAAGFSAMQLARIKQFMLQYSIAKQLQNKSVAGLVQLHELLQVPVAHLGDALFPILVFAHFDGPMLQSHYANPRYAGGFELDEFFNVAMQLASILASIHTQQFIHRDLTAANVLYDAHTRDVRVIDFGISTPFPSHTGSAKHVVKQLQGTLHYLSPEQTGRIGRIVDYRTDIFSLGVVLYQMLTGCLPLSKGTGPDMQDNLQLVHAILTQVPPTPAQLRPASIPLVLSHIIMKCIEKNPDDRYQSAFGLSVDLRSCLQLTQSLAAPPPGSLSFPLPLFQLGVWDQAAVFAVSKKLYGCSEAVSTLQRALESMLATRKTHVVAIRGSPGSGKSALIASVFSPLLASKSLLLVSSKLEEHHRQPFACLKQITNQLLLHFLTLSTSRLQAWKKSCLELFAGNGSLITQLFPVLEQIIGVQPPVRELAAQETQQRFNYLLTHFLCSFASQTKPLVIVFDDIQWADRFSLEAIEALVSNPACQHTLILLASRLQGDTREAQLSAMLQRMKSHAAGAGGSSGNGAATAAAGGGTVSASSSASNSPSPTSPAPQSVATVGSEQSVVSLLLQPLMLDSITQLVADTLCCSLFKALSLASFLLSQTAGSPLFVSQIMQALHRDGLLLFTFEVVDEEIAVGRETYSKDKHASSADRALSAHKQPAVRYHGEWTYDIQDIKRYFGIIAPSAGLVPHTGLGAAASGAMAGVLEPMGGAGGEHADGVPAAPSMLLFLQRHVAQLSSASRLVLKYASCVGFEFSLLLLCQLLNDRQLHYSASDIRAALQQPMKEELIVFVQQAGELDQKDPLKEAAGGGGAHGPSTGPKLTDEDDSESSPQSAEDVAAEEAEEGDGVDDVHTGHVGGTRKRTHGHGHHSHRGGGDQADESDAHMYNHTQQTRTMLGATVCGAAAELDVATISDSEAYAFLHDKIHEAIYVAISETERAAIHLRIAQIMLQQHDDAFERARLHTLALLTMQASQLPVVGGVGVAGAGHMVPLAGTDIAIALEPVRVADGPSAAASAAHLSEHHYFAIANHYLKCLPLLSSSPLLYKRAASFLLVASTSAKQVGAYLTALDFVKAAMQLMQVESAGADAHDAANSEVGQPRDKEEVTSSMSADSDAAGTAPLQRTLAEQLQGTAQMNSVWAVAGDYDLLFALSFARGELEYLCGHHQSSFHHFQQLLRRTPQLAQQIAIYRQLIRLKTIAGEYQAALRLSVQGLQLLGVEVVGLSIAADKKVAVDVAVVKDMFGVLQGLIDKYATMNETEERVAAQAARQAHALKLAARQQQALTAAQTGAASGVAAVDASGTALTPLEDSDEAQSTSEDSDDEERDHTQHGRSSRARGVDSASSSDGEHAEESVARSTIRSLLHHLPLCADARQIMVGDLYLESVFPAYMFNATVLQHVALSSVIHTIKHGLSGNEGFSFAMVGASLLATRIDDTRFVAADAQEWGQLGLGLCLKFNNQTDYCRTLMANALFINCFTGHLERSILELYQAIYIGSLVGDQQFVAQSSLAVVMLQQYTSSLGEWEEMLTQAQLDNQRLLQDYAVNKYTQGMKLILPTLMRPHSGGQTSTGANAGSPGSAAAAAAAALFERDELSPSVHVSRAERKFIDELHLEAGGESSLHLTLYAITKAKVQLCFHRPELAVETLKLADIHRVAGQPELITFLLVQSLTFLALIREQTEMQARINAAIVASSRVARDTARAAQEVRASATAGGLASMAPAQPVQAAAASAAQSAASSSAQAASDLLYLTYWRQVQLNQVQLFRFAQLNQRDFHCQYLLVRAEMAYTALYAYDQGIILEAGDQLSEDLLAPEVARAKQANNKGNRRRKKKQGEGDDEQENQLSGMMNAKAKKDRVAKEDLKRALRKERDAHARLSEAQPASGQLRSLLVGASGSLPPASVREARKPKKAVQVQTILTNDPLLRDQLVSRIAAVYSTAAAFAVSSRCNYADTTNSALPNQQSEAADETGGASSQRSAVRAHAATGGAQAGAYNPLKPRLGGSASGTSSASPSGGHSTTHRSNASALRCNDFIEGLSNELSCRFHFYVRRPQQAMNFLLIAMRSYGRWGALAVTASLQQEFAEQFADVIGVLTGASGTAGDKVGIVSHAARFRALPHAAVIRQRVPIGVNNNLQNSGQRGLQSSSHARPSLPMPVRLPLAGGVAMLPQLGSGTDSVNVSEMDCHSITSCSAAATPSLQQSTAGGSVMGVTASTQLTFTADFEIEHFNTGTHAHRNQPGSAAVVGSAAVAGHHPSYQHVDADVTSDSTSVLGDLQPERVQDLDIQSIIKAIQTISKELVLPNLISKLMRIILHNAGAQRATLLSRQVVAQQPLLSPDGSVLSSNGDDDAVDWRIDALIEYDNEQMYLNPQYASVASGSPQSEHSSAGSVDGSGEPGWRAPVSDADLGLDGHAPPLPISNVARTQSSDYPRSILNFVLHSQKSVILADASNDKVFGMDPCIRTRRSKSILCLPLVLRNSLISVLYLEHPTIPAAFTRDRLLSCRLITQQAAISMETAKLYSTMEARVTQRTAQLHRATQEAKEANQAKSTFLANMSHEIRTPMNGVLGAAELFDPSSTATEQRDLIGIIKSSGQAMLVLINDILDLSKIEAGKIELEEADVNLRECVDAAMDVVAQKALAKGLDIIAHVAPSVPYTIRCDASRLKQILFNLLSNAVKFTSDGQVTMTLHAVLMEAPQLLSPTPGVAPLPEVSASGAIMSAEPVRDCFALTVEVADSGIGISAVAQARLFTPFSQAHREINGKYGGTGLGLAISKSLVELLGGQIGLGSKLGQGSVFFMHLNVCGTRITQVQSSMLPPHLRPLLLMPQRELHTPVPCAISSLSPLKTVRQLSVSSSPNARRVLLLHRNACIAAVMHSMLEEFGLAVTACSAVEEFKAAWAEGGCAAFACVVFDCASLYVRNDTTYLASLFRATRGSATTLVACLPLGSSRRGQAELLTDSIVTQPIKAANLFAACTVRQLQLVPLVPAPSTPGTGVSRDDSGSSSAQPIQLGVNAGSWLASPALTQRGSGGPNPAPAAVPICLSPHDSVAPLSASGGLAVLRPHTHPLLLSSVAVHYPLRILIAEDNSINQRLISKMLSRLGFHTHQFRLTADGQSAAEEIQRANVRLPALLVVAASSASPEQLLPVPGVASSMPATSAASSVSGDRPSSATSLNIDSLSPAPLSGNSDSSADGLSTSPHVNSRSKQPLSASMLATSSAALVPATACPAAVVSTPATLLLPSVHVSPLHDSVAVAVVPVVSLPSTLVSSTCYDMILMDLQMPICDGFESTALIRGMSDITQPFICALTANAMEGDDKECIAQGMNHYMSKPLFVATLVQAIRLAHAHKLARDVSPPNALASLPTVTASPPTTAASPVGPFISPPSSSSSFLSSYALTAGGVAALVPVVVTSHTSTSGALDMQQQQQQQCTSPPTSDQLA